MVSKLESWAIIERGFIQEEIGFLKAGSKVLSPSGENITMKKIGQLEARLEHVNLALKDAEEQKRTPA